MLNCLKCFKTLKQYNTKNAAKSKRLIISGDVKDLFTSVLLVSTRVKQQFSFKRQN